MHRDCCANRRARGDLDTITAGLSGRGRGGRHGRGRRGRMFEQGEIKFVFLQLLDEKPRHGYDIIKALEERSNGAYSPSPGTVYPTLTLLEETGYAKGTIAEGGKRIYEITPEGKKHLSENANAIEPIFERISEASEPLFSPSMDDIHTAMRHLARSSLGTAVKHADNKEVLARITEVLRRAAGEIDGITA